MYFYFGEIFKMIKSKSLKDAAKYLTTFSEILAKYSFPLVNTEVEEEYLPFKTWNFPLDGYDVCVHMTEFFMEESIIQNLQIFPKKLYCLPFHISVKVAVAFLGNDDLVTFTVTKANHIVYCWTKIKEESRAGNVSVRNSIPTSNYLGVSYGILN